MDIGSRHVLCDAYKRTLIGKIDPDTGEMIPTDGRHRKTDEPSEKEPDYKKLYEKLLKKYEAQEVLIKSLKDEIKQLKADH